MKWRAYDKTRKIPASDVENSFDVPRTRSLLSATPMSCSSLSKRTCILFVAAVTIWTALPAAAAAQPHHKRLAREQIEALEVQWEQAMKANDLAAMDKLLSDDYLGVTINGDLVTKSQQLDRMRNREIQITSLDVSDIKIKVIGQIAIVNALATVEGTSEDGPLGGKFRYVRVYQRLPSGLWKITSFEVTRVPRNGGRRHTGGANAPPQQP